MTVRLREALQAAVDDLPGYSVYERALATARRTRRRAAAATAAVLVAAAALVWTVPLPHLNRVDSAAGTGALPDRVWVPRLGTLRVTDPVPLGAAAVLFSGMGIGDDGTVGVVGADADRYRVLRVGVEAPAGEVVLLSPDGTRLAYQSDGLVSGPRVGVVDLSNGSVRKIPAVADGSVWTRPLGWSRDGRRLVVVDSVPVDAQRSAYRSIVSLVELATGNAVRLATADDPAGIVPGYAVAFAPDGRRLALQIDGTVMVTDLVGTPGPTVKLPADTVLAGKGAWTPDGRGLTVAKRQDDTWTLATVDPTSGAALADLGLPAVSGVTAIRLLGWEPGGAALVVGYQPDPNGVPSQMEIDERINHGRVHSVRLLSLAPGAATPTVRMAAPAEVRAVDVADELIATGRTRTAQQPPDRPGPRFWFWPIAAAVVAAALLGRRWYVHRWLGRFAPDRRRDGR